MALAFVSSSGGGGGGGTVQSVTAGDTSIVVGGTAANPTVETADLATIATDHATGGDVALNSHKITGLAAGVAATDAANVGQLTGGTVTSVTAADTSVVVGGTAAAPTVRTGTLDVIAADHPPAANWSNNSKKITGLANGTAASDAAAFGQIPTALPPNGSAGGDLAGTYPNPSVKAMTETGGPTDLVLGAIPDGDFLKRSGATIVGAAGGTGTVTSVTAADTSVVVGGTATDPTVRTGTLDVIAADHPPAADWSNNSHKITSVHDPTAAQDAATKAYVDAAVPGNAGGKGHLTTATAVNTPADLSPGADGTALIADSSQSVGLRYAGSGTKQVPLPFDVPDASGNGYAALVAGTNLRTLRPAYTNGADGFWYGILDVPNDYSSAGAIVLWVAANDTTGHVSRWIVGTHPDSIAATFDAAYTAETAQNLTMSTTAYRPAALTFTLSTTPVAGNSLAFYVERNGSNGADTLTVPAFLFKAVFQYSI